MSCDICSNCIQNLNSFIIIKKCTGSFGLKTKFMKRCLFKNVTSLKPSSVRKWIVVFMKCFMAADFEFFYLI